MTDARDGAALVRKAEPTAADMALLRHRLDDDQAAALKRIVARGVRDGFTA